MKVFCFLRDIMKEIKCKTQTGRKYSLCIHMKKVRASKLCTELEFNNYMTAHEKMLDFMSPGKCKLKA